MGEAGPARLIATAVIFTMLISFLASGQFFTGMSHAAAAAVEGQSEPLDGQAVNGGDDDLGLNLAAPDLSVTMPLADTSCRPDLQLINNYAYWHDVHDYTSRRLTVPVRINAIGPCGAANVMINGAYNSLPTLLALDAPYEIGMISPGGYADVDLKFFIPMGVSGTFFTRIHGTAEDEVTGETYDYGRGPWPPGL